NNTEQITTVNQVHAQPAATRDGDADDGLGDEAHKPLAVVEAKKTSVHAQQGRIQARLYADWLEKAYDQRPIIFYTNGYDIWLWDDHKTHGYPTRRGFGFYRQERLYNLLLHSET